MTFIYDKYVAYRCKDFKFANEFPKYLRLALSNEYGRRPIFSSLPSAYVAVKPFFEGEKKSPR